MRSILLITVMLKMAHAHSKCESEPLGGNLKFRLPADITTQMMERQCELQLAVEGYNRAIYEKGTVPGTMQLPVLNATMYDFTLNTCPGSVVLYLECPQILVTTTTIHCSCVNSTTSTTSTTSFRTKYEAAQDDTLDSSRHHATAYVVTAAICICIVGLLGLLIYQRKKNRSSVIIPFQVERSEIPLPDPL